jgi:hypothetical protein
MSIDLPAVARRLSKDTIELLVEVAGILDLELLLDDDTTNRLKERTMHRLTDVWQHGMRSGMKDGYNRGRAAGFNMGVRAVMKDRPGREN